MKKNYYVNYDAVIEKRKEQNLISGDTLLVRCGKVGQWKEFMSPEMIEKFEKWERTNLAGTGLSF